MAGKRTVYFVVAGDASSYQQMVSGVEASGGRLATVQEQLGRKVDATTTKLHTSGATGREAFGLIGTAMSATGQQFGPITTALERMDTIFDTVSQKAGRLGKITTGVGLAGAAVGGLGMAASAQEQTAQVNLANAVQNTGHAWDDYSKKLEAVANAQAHFGVTSAQAMGALATLTAASHDPIQATKDLTTAENLAAREHISVGDAAQQMAQIYGGNLRTLRQFGINVKDLIDPQKELTKATRDQTAAAAEMASAQQRLADVQARVSAAEQAAQEQYTAKVETAKQHLVDADQRLTDVESANAQARKDREAAAAQGIVDSTQRLADAKQHLIDVELQIHESTQLTIADQHQLRDAQQSLADVNDSIATGELQGQQAVIARRDAEQRLADLQESQAQKQKLSLTQERELRDAHKQVATATDDVTKARAKASTAAQTTLAEQRAIRTALDNEKKARVELAAVQAKGPAAVSLGLRQEEAAAERAYRKAQAHVDQANKEMAQARADAEEFPTKISHALALLDGAVHGAADEQSKTFTGMLKHWVASADNALAHIGTKYSGIITAVSVGITVASSLVQAFVTRSAAKTIATQTALNADLIAENAATDATIVAESVAAGEASSLALGPVVLALAAIAIAAYELYKHWHAVWNAIKKAFDVVWGFLKRDWKEIIAFMLGGLGVYELYKHWDKVWSGIKWIVSHTWDGIKHITEDFINWMIDAFNGLVKVILMPFNFLIDAINTVIGAIDAIHVDLPFGWGHIGFDIPKLPHVSLSVDHVGGGGSGPPIHGSAGGSGGAAGAGGVRAFAAGGHPMPGEIVRVGEHGVELAQFLSPVRVYPHGQAPAAVGGDGAAVVVHVDARGALFPDHASLERFAETIAEPVKQAIRRHKNITGEKAGLD